MRKNDETYLFGAGEGVVPGEIIEISGKTLKRNSLKFTFDTFYLDASSIGVVAGYTLKDRKELADNGVLTFVIEEDVRSRAIV
jgi:mRNA degradation ribonuclease J1/J2